MLFNMVGFKWSGKRIYMVTIVANKTYCSSANNSKVYRQLHSDQKLVDGKYRCDTTTTLNVTKRENY